MGSDTFHFNDKCPLSRQWFDRVGGTPAVNLTNGLHEKLKHPQEADRISAWTSSWRKPSNCNRFVSSHMVLYQRTEFGCDITGLPKKAQQTEDHSSLYSQLSLHMEEGYNKAARSWPPEQFLLPFLTESSYWVASSHSSGNSRANEPLSCKSAKPRLLAGLFTSPELTEDPIPL